MATSPLTERGWPRPHIGGFPIPWVSPPADLSKEDPDRHDEVIENVLCQVCGEGHEPGSHVFLLVNDDQHGAGEDVSDQWALAIDDAIMHERCLRLAAGRCPELKRLRAAGRMRVLTCPVSAVSARKFDDERERRLTADGAHCTVLDTETFLTGR